MLPSSYLTNGIHTAALKQICLVQYCHLVRPSQTSHSTALLCLTPPKASTLTNPTRMTFMRSQGPSMRADVSTENFVFFCLRRKIEHRFNRQLLCVRPGVRRGGGAPAEGEDWIRLPHPGGRRGRAGCESGRPWQGSYGTGWTTLIF